MTPAAQGRATAPGPHSAQRARSRSRTGPAAAFFLGALTVGGYAPFHFFLLPCVTLALLMLQWHSADSARRAAWLGGWFGLGFFLAGVSWVYVSLHEFGAMPAPLAALATLLFCVYLALYPAAAGYFTRRFPGRPALRYGLLAPAAWALLEWVRGWLFTGFPWLALGYSQIPRSPLAGYAPLLGIGGVTLATALTAGLTALLALAARSQRRGIATAMRHPALYALALVWVAGYGLQQVRWTHPSGAPLTVSLLQGDIPQDMKWQPDRLRATLESYRELALASTSRLTVFPETAIPLFLSSVPRAYLAELAQHARDNHGDMLIGIPEDTPSGKYYNSVISLGSSPSQVYRKRHLVPFGEFIPLRPLLGPIVAKLAIPLQDFSRGTDHPHPLRVAGERVAVDICYEDAFGEEIIRQLPEATLLVNASNVAWFGHSLAPYQHLQIAQARALEAGRYMLTATNTGMTAVINPRGRVDAVAPEFVRTTVTHQVQGYAGATPYVLWGDRALLMLCAALVVCAYVMGRRSR